jgi:glycine hydroxymethyltransferase
MGKDVRQHPAGRTTRVAAKEFDVAGIELNDNAIPFDPLKPFDPSGIRLGTSSVTSRGMAEPEMRQMEAVVGAPATPRCTAGSPARSAS